MEYVVRNQIQKGADLLLDSLGHLAKRGEGTEGRGARRAAEARMGGGREGASSDAVSGESQRCEGAAI